MQQFFCFLDTLHIVFTFHLYTSYGVLLININPFSALFLVARTIPRHDSTP